MRRTDHRSVGVSIGEQLGIYYNHSVVQWWQFAQCRCAEGVQEGIDLDAVGESVDGICSWVGNTWLSGKDEQEDKVRVWG